MVPNKTIAAKRLGTQLAEEANLRAMAPEAFRAHADRVNAEYAAWHEADEAIWAIALANSKKREAQAQVPKSIPRRRTGA